MSSLGLLFAAVLTVVPGNNMPLVEASLDGKQCTLLVDTGASHTTFDLAFITNALPAVKLEEVQLIGRTNVRVPPKFAAVTNLTVGTESFAVEGVMALDLAHLTHGVGRKVDGILGMNHLRLKPCIISLKRGMLEWNPDVAALEGFHPVLTRDRGTTHELIVKLPSGEITPLLIDTGSSFTFLNKTLWPAKAETVKMGTSDVNSQATIGFVRGEKGTLDCGHGYALAVEPILTEETNRNQLGGDVFREVDIYLSDRSVRLR